MAITVTLTDSHGVDYWGYVESLGVDRSLTTDLPSQVRRSVGYSAAELTVTLSGSNPSGVEAAALDKFSPLSGKANALPVGEIVTVTVASPGVGTGTRFVGRIRSKDIAAAAGTVTIDALDPSDAIRGAVSFPDLYRSDWGHDITHPGTNSAWLVDYIAGAVGLPLSLPALLPTLGSDRYVGFSFAGGPFPTVQGDSLGAWDPFGPTSTPMPPIRPVVLGPTPSMAATDAQQITGTQRMPCMSFKRSGLEVFAADDDDVFHELIFAARGLVQATKVGDSAMVYTRVWSSDPDPTFAVYPVKVRIDWVAHPTDGTKLIPKVTAIIANSGGNPSSTIVVKDGTDVATGVKVGNFLDFAVDVNGVGTTSTVYLQFPDGAVPSGSGATVTKSFSIPADAGWTFNDFLIGFGSDTAGVLSQWCYSADALDGLTVPTATLDLGKNTIRFAPRSNVDAWPTLQEIAAAELALIGFDETGAFAFRNRDWLRGQVALPTAYTASSSIVDAKISISSDGIVNDAVVAVTEPTVGPVEIVWSSAADIVLRAGKVQLIPIVFSDPVTGLIINQLGQGATPKQATDYDGQPISGSRFDGDFDTVNGGIKVYPNINVSKIEQGTATLRASNDTGMPYMHVIVTDANASEDYPAGRPALWIYARRITVDGSRSARQSWQASIDKYGPQTYNLTSDWIQNLDDGQATANALVEDSSLPYATVSGLVIVGDPTLKLGARITVSDPVITDLQLDGWIVSIRDQISRSGGYTQEIDLRVAAAEGDWILGDATASILGSTTNL